MVPSRHRPGLAIAFLLGLSACHDAPRTNPFDPALTPAVELQVALDDTAGTAILTWTRYEGQQPFREYWVLRNQVERTRVDTLERISAVDQTTYADTSLAPSTGYEYRVSVVNASGLEVESAKKGLEGYALGALRLYPVEGDPQVGALVVHWNRYVGPDFHGYQLKRRPVGTDQEEVLAEIAAVADTSYVDSSVANGQGYAYLVLVQAGSERLQSNSAEGQLVLPPVEITRADFSSTTATAALRWTAYPGPRFKAYRVERRTAELAVQVVKEISNLVDTTYVDSLLSGNTEYFYRVVVETERSEELPSQERNGIFHQLLATWPLGAEMQSRGHLYVEPGDRIIALVPRANGIVAGGAVLDDSWILSFDPAGQLLEERMLSGVLLSNWALSDEATCLNPEGRRFLGLSNEATAGILSFGSDGQPLFQERALFTDAFPDLSAAEKGVQGEILLTGSGGYFDNVRVSAGGRLLFAEDFEEFPEGLPLTGPQIHNWEASGEITAIGGRVYLGEMHRADETWQNFRLEAEVEEGSSVGNRIHSIQIGGKTFSRFVLTLNFRKQQALLDWGFSPPGELEQESQEKSLPLPLMWRVFYGLSLEAVDGAVSASMRDPMIWTEVLGQTYIPYWNSLALVGDVLAFTRDDQVYSITQKGEVIRQASFKTPISEIRVWDDPQDGAQRVGVCMPDMDQIWISRVPASNPSNWFTLLPQGSKIGPELGPTAGFLSSPISFAVGPDGRFYVLDASNARVVVFDAQRHYLTQWGRKGSEEGEFNFGRGGGEELTPSHFAGSVAVDSQGYIYVLDVFNKRIQKFAP